MILLGVPIAYFWAKANARNLEVTTERPVDRLQEGQDFVERITVKNQSWFTKLWLEVEDPSDMPGHNASADHHAGAARVADLADDDARAALRGLFSVGPVTITTGDPFGFFRYTNTYGRPQSILVYPRATELPNFYVPPANLPGEGRFRKRTHYVTPNASGVRAYEPGDSFNRIHWPTTARTEPADGQAVRAGPGQRHLDHPRPRQDGARRARARTGRRSTRCKIAASIARFFLVANRSVGFISYGKRLFVEEAERGAQHYTRILEALALATAEGDVPIGTLITRRVEALRPPHDGGRGHAFDDGGLGGQRCSSSPSAASRSRRCCWSRAPSAAPRTR